MDPESFVEALQQVVASDAVDGLLHSLADPPGRRPAPTLLEASAWFRALAPSDRAMLERVMRMVVHDTLFGVLCVLDGVRPVEGLGDKGDFHLQFTKHGSVTTLIGAGAPLAHDLLGSFDQQARPDDQGA